MARSRGWRQGVRADDDGGSGTKHSGNFGELMGHIVRDGQGVAQRTCTGTAANYWRLENATDAETLRRQTVRVGVEARHHGARRPISGLWRTPGAGRGAGSGRVWRWQSCAAVLAFALGAAAEACTLCATLSHARITAPPYQRMCCALNPKLGVSARQRVWPYHDSVSQTTPAWHQMLSLLMFAAVLLCHTGIIISIIVMTDSLPAVSNNLRQGGDRGMETYLRLPAPKPRKFLCAFLSWFLERRAVLRPN
ncbi:hypothetical protein TRIATDRAFT_88531 [Trichoderma atroviride IMI 206040]|uniref:Uncharacterized protein n=1 Tax=Hypocrea atroviridis (strain ATCC 20476 / IMI 206040) TaxID=452589 RepID=G9NTQ1_HYPAI|nr:uncharacterized protein TRIATDRAFT_88531 [Trichoderma atroviride IMI 206040]EHK46091.1 hypothetical protein TRIATDRAFT_88531 [Trichoderma atroviride IMI 206040]